MLYFTSQLCSLSLKVTERGRNMVPYKTTWICRVAEILAVKRPVHTFYFPFLFSRKRWQPGCVTKNYPLKTSKVQFPSYCKIQEHDSSHGLSLLVNHWKQESWEPQLLSQMLLSSVNVVNPKYAARNLIWARWIIEKKKNHMSSSSFIMDKNLFSHRQWQTVPLLLKLYWNSGPRADLQTSCFERKSAILLYFSFVSWDMLSFLIATGSGRKELAFKAPYPTPGHPSLGHHSQMPASFVFPGRQPHLSA